MKISLEWIHDYVKPGLPPQELVERLTMIGLVAETIDAAEGDIVLDLETYANRPDTLGHLGVAREIAAMLDLPLEEKTWPLTELTQRASDLTDVQVHDENLCPRYCGMLVKGVTVGPSPEWLRRRLQAVGLRPINNVVDTTNFVLFATGQPIHAFDFAKLAGSKIIVRRAFRGEKLTDLDGRTLELQPDMLVIADEAKPVALAGIIGGRDSAVGETTRDVFIESAHFDPVSIRLTAKRLGLSTDASYRFERGTDIGFPAKGALMTASLLTQMGGRAAKGILDVYPKPRKPKFVVLRHQRIGELIGVDVPPSFVEKTLSRLEFGVESSPRGSWRVEIPSFRVDIDREADLIEEVARFYGYDKIPSEVTPAKSFEAGSNRKRDRILRLRQILLEQGFDEVINFSFADPEKESLVASGRIPVGLKNPLSAKAAVLRTNLLMGMLENAAWNRNRGAEGVHVFEVGNTYFFENERPEERLTLGVLSTGALPGAGWQQKPAVADFFLLKGALEEVLTGLRYEPYRFGELNHPSFEEGRALTLFCREQTVGRFGLLRKGLTSAYGLDGEVFAAEVDLGLLFAKQPRAFQYTPVPKFPAVSRDLSFLVDASVTYQDIKKALDKLAPPLVESFELADRFSGPAIAPGKVSLTFRFRYRHAKRTLAAEDVDHVEQEIVLHLKSVLGIQLREGKIDN